MVYSKRSELNSMIKCLSKTLQGAIEEALSMKGPGCLVQSPLRDAERERLTLKVKATLIKYFGVSIKHSDHIKIKVGTAPSVPGALVVNADNVFTGLLLTDIYEPGSIGERYWRTDEFEYCFKYGLFHTRKL